MGHGVETIQAKAVAREGELRQGTIAETPVQLQGGAVRRGQGKLNGAAYKPS